MGVLEPLPQPDTFLYNTGQVTSLDDPDLNFRQTYDLIRINRDNGTQKTVVNDAVSAPSSVGAASMPNYNSNLFDAATAEFGSSPAWRGPGSPTTRSSSTCVCSTCCARRT